jgi:hypothetical protein
MRRMNLILSVKSPTAIEPPTLDVTKAKRPIVTASSSFKTRTRT